MTLTLNILQIKQSRFWTTLKILQTKNTAMLSKDLQKIQLLMCQRIRLLGTTCTLFMQMLKDMYVLALIAFIFCKNKKKNKKTNMLSPITGLRNGTIGIKHIHTWTWWEYKMSRGGATAMKRIITNNLKWITYILLWNLIQKAVGKLQKYNYEHIFFE